MSEATQGSPGERWKAELEEGTPRRRRGMPMWFWGCGGGCLLTLALFIGGTIWIYSQFRDLVGPERAWPAVAEIMPYGETPPDGYTPTLIDQAVLREAPIARWFLEKAGPGEADVFVPVGHRVITIMENPNDDRPAGSGTRLVLWQLGPMENVEDYATPGTFDELAAAPRENEEDVELVLQGKTVSGVRGDIIGQEIPFLGEQDIQELVIDLSQGRDRPLVLRMIATGETKATEEELNRFLEPFQVWPDSPR